MNYDLYRYIFICAAILAGIMFVVSVVIFIIYRIPKVISDLSGATARKAIKNIREQNEASGEKAYKGSVINEARGKLTDKISPSGRIMSQDQSPIRYGVDTTKIRTQHLPNEDYTDQTTVLEASDDTYMLECTANETTLLTPETCTQTTLLRDEYYDETSVISDQIPAGETTVLSNNYNEIGFFEIEYEITYIHTDEIIVTEAIR